MNMHMTENFDRKAFNALYETIVENGNTALKPLAPIPDRPHLYLVPKPAAEKPCPAPRFGLSRLAKWILGFVACFCIYAAVAGHAALIGDLIGCGAVAYFATLCLGE